MIQVRSIIIVQCRRLFIDFCFVTIILEYIITVTQGGGAQLIAYIQPSKKSAQNYQTSKQKENISILKSWFQNCDPLCSSYLRQTICKKQICLLRNEIHRCQAINKKLFYAKDKCCSLKHVGAQPFVSELICSSHLKLLILYFIKKPFREPLTRTNDDNMGSKKCWMIVAVDMKRKYQWRTCVMYLSVVYLNICMDRRSREVSSNRATEIRVYHCTHSSRVFFKLTEYRPTCHHI